MEENQVTPAKSLPSYLDSRKTTVEVLRTMRCLDLLFYNFRQEDITAISEFNPHIWSKMREIQAYLGPNVQAITLAMWYEWLSKCSNSEMTEFVLKIAVDRYYSQTDYIR